MAIPDPVIIRNLIPLFGWIVMAGFLAGVAAMTWILHTEGTEPGTPPWLQIGALAVFWGGGVTAGGHLFRKPCTRLDARPGGAVTYTRVWPLWRRRERLPREAIRDILVAPGRDSEGDPYFRTLLILADGRRLTVSEGHHAPTQRGIAARLRGAVGPQPESLSTGTRAESL